MSLPGRIPADVLAVGTGPCAARFGSLDLEIQLVLLNVADMIASIEFGTVQIVLQDGQVIQLQTSERIRLR